MLVSFQQAHQNESEYVHFMCVRLHHH